MYSLVNGSAAEASEGVTAACDPFQRLRPRLAVKKLLAFSQLRRDKFVDIVCEVVLAELYLRVDGIRVDTIGTSQIFKL